MDINLIVGIVLFGLLALFVVIGALKGFLRIIISTLCSSVVCLAAAGAIAFLAPVIFDLFGINFDLGGEIISALEGFNVEFINDLIPTLSDNLMNDAIVIGDVEIVLSIVNIIVMLGYFVVSLLVFRLLFSLLRVIALRSVRGVKSKTADVLLGGVIWGAIGAVIVVALIIGIWQVASLEFLSDIELVQDLIEIPEDPAFFSFAWFVDLIRGFNIGFLNDLIGG